MTPAAPPLEDTTAPASVYARGAAALRAHHDIVAGPPEAASAWRQLSAFLPWLDRVRDHCIEPPPNVAKASEWLFDNEFHLRRAVRQVREDLPASFYRRLPRLAATDYCGIPRVLALARGMLDVAQIQVGLAEAADYTNTYQRDGPLTIAELWAFPAMLRLVCLEELVQSFSELLPQLASPFKPTPRSTLHQPLDPAEGVSRAISALVAISNIPWKKFFEQVSRVEAILQDDPADVYSAMDFDTRDQYRKAVEDIADGAPVSEWEVADAALELARAHAGARRSGHVGCWLIAEGRAELERQVGFRAGWRTSWRRWVMAHPGRSYAGALTGFTVAALFFPAQLLAMFDASAAAWVAGLALALTPAMIISVTFTHWLVSRFVPPRVLPKLAIENGLDAGCETVLVVPVILRHEAEVAPLIERLEMHWLSNPDPLIRMALLSDLADADSEHTPVDAPIEAALVAGVRRLNARYAEQAPFALLHRKRRWNAADGRWMGWERKRGKLEELVGLILSHLPDAFVLREGDIDTLCQARFVVTLDADTKAQPNAINRLVGTLAHPLNRVELDSATGRPTRGYTFIQPRVEISPDAGDQSLFTRLYTGDTAIDIYSRAASDVYQDLFGEGIFTGKGAFDVAAFHECLHGRVPENAILSHDLFEGLHGRAALASDIVFYEDFPANYLAYSRRALRWIRGDWQLTPWLGGIVPSRGDRRVATRLSALDRWKMLDNLRRSLIAPMLVALATAGWLMLPGQALIWTMLTVGAPGAHLFTDIIPRLARGRKRGTTRSMLHALADHAGRWLLAVIFLAHEAAVASEAIARTLWRVRVSHRRLLEWTSAAHSATEVSQTWLGTWREMAAAPALAVVITLTLVWLNPVALPGAAPLLLLWLASPQIAWLISRKRQRVSEILGAEDRLYLRLVARRTWLYFETFAGPDDNWLPPDNYQAAPHEEIAHRSSPTNVGMLFLSALTAWDLGHIGRRDLAARMSAALAALDRLESHAGHTLNWFNTRTLEPLEPRYVSTVDSGNLAVSLLTLCAGCREAAAGPAMSPVQWDGLGDTLLLLREAASALPETDRGAIADHLDAIVNQLPAIRRSPKDWRSALMQLATDDWPQVQMRIARVLETGIEANSHEIHLWLKRANHHLMTMRRDLGALAPWLALTETSPAGLEGVSELIEALPPPDAPFAGITDRINRTRRVLSQLVPVDPESRRWVAEMTAALDQGETACHDLRDSLHQCAARAEARAFAMDFHSLYDEETSTFFIGHNLDSDHLDPHHYDLLASEARLTSYFAIAKRDVPIKHWFHLGRPITRAAGALTMLSWNGSMFEYLMPTLLLPSEAGRLLGQSERAAVAVQRRYGETLGLPWGVSESGFAVRDDSHHYQYQAFGVPGLGLKRDLAKDYVVAPYASALALSVAPAAATSNLRRLDGLGLRDRYGFFEAADFTPDRLPAEGDFSPVRAYMAHHQGMICAAIGNALNDDILIRRFRRDPRLRATELLLQERVPWELPPERPTETVTTTPDLTRIPTPTLHSWSTPHQSGPQLHVLGNGSLAAWISDTGDGALWWRGQALTHWAGDPVRRGGEARIHVSEPDGGAIWTLGGHGSNRVSDTCYYAHKIEFHERREGLSTNLEIVIAASDDVEIRRVTLSNDSDRVREMDVTSYAEIVLAPAASHERHPAFSKLFIHSERLDDQNALVFERRPRRLDDQPPVLLHRLLSTDAAVTPAGFETDRRRFLGRHGDPERPPGATAALDGAVGWTLDPIMALRAHVILEPGAQARIDFVTVAAGSRKTALGIAEHFATGPALDWATEDARRSVALEAQRLGLDSRMLAEAQTLCRDLVFPRTPPILLAAAGTALPAQPHLWSMGLSGDLPIVLVRVVDEAHATLLPTIIRAHRWWQRRGLRADLVFLQDGLSGYEEPIRDLLFAALSVANLPEGLGGRGGIHLLATERVGAVERRALEATARMTLFAAAESLATAVAPPQLGRTPLPRFQPLELPTSEPLNVTPLLRPDNLVFDNSLGGFTPAAGDYAIHLDGGRVTPSPWCNVLANESFGSIVSEAGLGFTWCINSGEHRLTPWSNDPVVDPQTEALYLRDEETADIWTPTPLPAGGHESCQIHHRAGATTWRRNAEGLEQRLTVFVPPDATVKLALLTLANPGDRGRRFTATYYAEWLLGSMTSAARPHLVCGFDAENQALIARNGWNPEFGERTAFLAASRQPHSLTCDRAAFLGRHGDPARPAGLVAWSLDGALDNVADPCAAFQVHIDLAAGATEEVVFVLGEGSDPAEAARLASHWANVETAKQGLADNDAAWKQRLGAVQVTTPDPAFDLMVNRWLINQTFASRVLARAAFQQAGGAFGFRDQLQDMMSLMFIEPQRVRAHILDSASHQFEEGDVLHWWHPPQGRGVRTRCSDDLLWLVYATGRYVEATGDTSILAEEIPFLSAPPLEADEEDRYAPFNAGKERGTLFEHCRRALDRGVTAGVHGLPLIGAGDWNDGMNRVGIEGHGESVWLAWFAATCAEAFANLAKDVGRNDLDNLWRARADDLRRVADASGWDGAWYMRAFADDGLPWGSKDSEECQIDSISQSWAALADGPSSERTAAAINAATDRLVDHDARLVRLLTPPFDRTLRDPGYIRAYPPGVRENGGQYTHAAAWLGLAHARLGNGDLAYEIFDLINPIRRTDDLGGAELYRGEPYVLAADVRGAGPGTGQAGWTWYTGAAGWSWQLAVEGILGLSLQRGAVRIAPRIPTSWGGARVRINGPDGVLIVTIKDPERVGTGRVELAVDGQPVDDDCIAIPTDGTTKRVTARLRCCSIPASRNRR
ncbi:cyclic beta-1,2-glucan synthetase [Marinobacter antarcticus]|uniref:Cyclic beta-1,2-glucan synthetase n=1 Tax=Marinobacter antarcticus TaxID=564117 RepID=A0A1M6SIG5_9GAMM|nr:glucoamylase family protein [Marinobacter antarcticus]SHK44409.1 cyclic beta-1,2-glucan synthetase [Marinobacter antarcticus]